MAEQRGVLDEMEAFFDERPVDELLFSMSSLGETQRALTEKPLHTLADMIGDEDRIIIPAVVAETISSASAKT